ncbi:hypothetical protein BH23CHL8_BH23CHL8_00850 [soil metagenome]
MAETSYSGKADFHAVLGRALIDPGFREQLMDSEHQVDALKAMGVDPTDEVLQALNEALDALGRLADSFGGPRAAT